jgi:rhodanese-related sulfurtransferase
MTLIARLGSLFISFVVSCLGLLVVSSALAQGSSMTASEALKDVKPAGAACRRDEAASSPLSVRTRQMPSPDMTCMVSAQELGLWVKAGQIAVVDTRLSSEYTQFHIDSALNISATEVVHKPQLRNKAMVLMGTGKFDRELYSVCAELKASGFTSVKVLQGGMLAWLDAGQPVIGRAAMSEQLRRLEPAELFAESQFGANLVLVTPTEVALTSQISYAVAATQDNPEALKFLLDRHRKEMRSSVLNAVVLVTSPKIRPSDLLQWQAAASPLPLLVYTEGVPAYQRYLATQKAVWLAQARGPKQPTCGL